VTPVDEGHSTANEFPTNDGHDCRLAGSDYFDDL
jgi:hypothetical protein